MTSGRAGGNAGAVVGRAAVAVVVSALLVGAGMAGVLIRLNGMSWLHAFAPLTAQLTALYALVYAVPVGAMAVGALLLGRRPGLRFFVAVSLGFTALFNGLLRFKSMVQPLSVTPHLSAIGVLDGITVLAAALLLGSAVLLSGRRAGIAAGAAVVLLLALTGIHRLDEAPLRRDLPSAVAPLLSAPAPELAASGERLRNTKLVVLGLDGLSWEVLLPLLRNAELPALRGLLDGAAYGYLDTLSIAISPVVWETISTGQPPARHGIGYHAHFEMPGLGDRIRILPHMRLQNTLMGIRRLLSLSASWAPWSQVPADSTDARVARIWEIAARSGLTVGVYDWMNTTPVAPTSGFLHGYYPVPPTLYPADLLAGEPELPAEVPGVASGVEWVHAKIPRERAKFEQFTRLARRYDPQVLFYYTHFGDAVNHVNWKQESHGPGPFVSGLEHPELDFAREGAVATVNRFLDSAVGEILGLVQEDATVVLISDHGFDFRGYEHDNCPPGVVVLRGPGIAPGLIEEATVFDVSPTLLHLMGLRLAQDMDGAPLPVAEAGGPFDRTASAISSYGAASEPLAAESLEQDELEQHEEYLRSLGYVN